jgi:hypothetical protein
MLSTSDYRLFLPQPQRAIGQNLQGNRAWRAIFVLGSDGLLKCEGKAVRACVLGYEQGVTNAAGYDVQIRSGWRCGVGYRRLPGSFLKIYRNP